MYILNPYPSFPAWSTRQYYKLFTLEIVFLSSESSHSLHRITLTCVCLDTWLSNLG